MKLGSLFDGAGTFPFAGSMYGIVPVWASEIEAFPIEVTKKRLPKMKHLGDICKINGAEIPPVDIITFGSPCQDLSVAGKQAGLDGERSGLFREAIRIIKEMRGKTNGKYPRYAIWENVPGAFSSNKGEDFRIVLQEFCQVKDGSTVIPRPPGGKWRGAGLIVGNDYSIAWRILDAQFWGVPQRRRRIFLVADFGSGSAGEILFEQEGLSRSFEKIRGSWQGITGSIASCAHLARRSNGSGIEGNGDNPPQPIILNDQGGESINIEKEQTIPTLRAQAHGNLPIVAIPVENHPMDSRVTLGKNNTVETLTSRMGTGGGNVPLLIVGVDTYNQAISEKAKTLLARHIDPDGVPCIAINLLQDPIPNKRIAPCLSTGNPKTGQANIAICMATQQGGAEITENFCPTITAAAGMSGNNQPCVCYQKTVGSLCARDWKGVGNQYVNEQKLVVDQTKTKWIVRRLTPTECARLQGMPDWWCKDIPHSDSAEYKMWGNGMALPCVLYVMQGVADNKKKSLMEVI